MALTAGRYATDTRTKLNRNQVKGFWAAWGGWTLDGMDSFIYALVAAPALMELLPRSGIAATPRNVGFYFSGLQALFLLGYGLSMVWGPIARLQLVIVPAPSSPQRVNGAAFSVWFVAS